MAVDPVASMRELIARVAVLELQLSAPTWLQYRARARRELIELAARPDCVRPARSIRREVDLWVTFP